MLNSRRGVLVTVVAGMVLAAAPVEGQVALEVRGGFNLPTFKIADAAKAGPSVGAGLNVKLADRLWLIGDADFGFHKGTDLPAGGSGADVDTWAPS